jgi:hypothetical protein
MAAGGLRGMRRSRPASRSSNIDSFRTAYSFVISPPCFFAGARTACRQGDDDMNQPVDPRYREMMAASADLFREDISHRLTGQLSLAEKLLQSLVFANGGAIIGLFTFIGAIADKNSPVGILPGPLWKAFWFFALGLSAALTTYLFGFLSQAAFMIASSARYWNAKAIAHDLAESNDATRPTTIGNVFWYVAIACGGASTILFTIGANQAFHGVLPRSAPSPHRVAAPPKAPEVVPPGMPVLRIK